MRPLVAVVLACAALASAQSCNPKLKHFTANFDNLPPGTAPPDNYGSVGWSNFVVRRKHSTYAIAPSTPPRAVIPQRLAQVPYIFQTNYTNGADPGSAAFETFAVTGFSFGCASSPDGLRYYQPSACTVTLVANSFDPAVGASSQSFDYSPGAGAGMTNVTANMAGTDFYLVLTSGPGATVVSYDSFKIGQYIC